MVVDDGGEGVTAFECHERQTGAGVAGGRFDNVSARAQFAAAFGLQHHLPCHPHLRRTGGIELLQFQQQPGSGTGPDEFE